MTQADGPITSTSVARSERVELSVDADSGVFIASEDKRSSETIFVFQRVNRQTEQPMLRWF